MRSKAAHFNKTFAPEITNKGSQSPTEVRSTRAADAWERYFVPVAPGRNGWKPKGRHHWRKGRATSCSEQSEQIYRDITKVNPIFLPLSPPPETASREIHSWTNRSVGRWHYRRPCFSTKALDFILPFLAMAMLKQVWHCSSGLTKALDFILPFLAMAMLKQVWHCSSGLTKALDFILPFLAMAMPKQAWHCSSGLTKAFFEQMISDYELQRQASL